MKNEKKKENNLIMFFFIGIITLFTIVNMYEFVADKEPDGHIKGLDSLCTVSDTAVTLWGGCQKIMGKQLAFGTTVYEDVTKLTNGYSTMADKDNNYEPAVRGVLDAKAIADGINAQFLYVAVPPKQRGMEDLPKGAVDYAVEKYYGMVDAMAENDIDCIAMRDVMETEIDKNEEIQNWFDFYYFSDHHWRNNAAFLCYEEICAYLNEKGFAINEEYLQTENYEIAKYENVFLGTHGRMAGPLYTGLDDYELYLPKFDTTFTLDVPSQGIHKEGSFEETFVNYENLQHYSYDYYAYYAYLKEDFDLFEIVNNANPEGVHVLLVRDSSAVPVSVLLANQCSELDIVDLRYTTDRNVRDYIKSKSPDVIIYLFGSGYLGNESAVVIPEN